MGQKPFSSLVGSTTGAADDCYRLDTIPAELRLKILAFTDLGPAEKGDYHKRHEIIRIEQGKLATKDKWGNPIRCGCRSCCDAREKEPYVSHAPIDSLDTDEKETSHDASSASAASTPEACDARRPLAPYFLISKQIYEEALDVFYPNTEFSLKNEDMSAHITFLRDALPGAALSKIRKLTIDFTGAQVLTWNGEETIQELQNQQSILRRSAKWAKEKGMEHDPPVDVTTFVGKVPGQFRELVGFIKEHLDITQLHLTIDMEDAVWLFADEWAGENLSELDEGVQRFGWVSKMYQEIATELCALEGLREVKFGLSLFEDMGPWMEREILGKNFKGAVAKKHPEGPHDRLCDRYPHGFDPNKRLKGSNYVP
jgi:hypothetical protein